MIVVWGIDGDGPTDAVRAALSAIDAPATFVNQRDHDTTCVDLDIDPHGQPVGTITVDGQRLSIDDVEAMYVRPYNTEQVVGPIDQQAVASAIATDMSLSAFADLCQGFVVNRPFRMASNNSKPYQMEVIRAHGFDVPETLITTDPDAALTFVERCGRVIYKSISGVRSVVQSLGADDRARLVDVAHSPTQFQEQVDGTDVRVHVVGDRCFATAIESGADDYRYACRQQHDATLSETDPSRRRRRAVCRAQPIVRTRGQRHRSPALARRSLVLLRGQPVTGVHVLRAGHRPAACGVHRCPARRL